MLMCRTGTGCTVREGAPAYASGDALHSFLEHTLPMAGARLCFINLNTFIIIYYYTYWY